MGGAPQDAPKDVTLSHLQGQGEQSEGQCPLTAMFNAAPHSPQPALLCSAPPVLQERCTQLEMDLPFQELSPVLREDKGGGREVLLPSLK